MSDKKKKNKYSFWKEQKDCDTNNSIAELQSRLTNIEINKYYNVWMSKFEWGGLDEESKEQQENYIMRKFWSDGTIACRLIDKINMLVFCPYSTSEYNYYDFPSKCTLENKRGASKAIIPSKTQTVNEDIVLLWCMPNHKSIEFIVRWYVERIVQVNLVINTNLHLQQMPYVIGCTEEDQEQFEDIIKRILHNELVVYTSVGDISRLQALSTNVPYLIDKLKAYEVSLENELLTILGINNSGVEGKKAQMLVDEVNSNNEVISDYGTAIEDEIKKGLEQIKRVFGREITIKTKNKVEYSDKDYEDASITAQKTKEGEKE